MIHWKPVGGFLLGQRHREGKVWPVFWGSVDGTKSKGVGRNQARGLKRPTERQGLYPRVSEEFLRIPQGAAGSRLTKGQGWSQADSEGL